MAGNKDITFFNALLELFLSFLVLRFHADKEVGIQHYSRAILICIIKKIYLDLVICFKRFSFNGKHCYSLSGYLLLAASLRCPRILKPRHAAFQV